MTPFSFVMHQWSCRKADSSSLCTRDVAKVNFLFYLHGKKWNSWKTSWITWIRGELTGCNNSMENQLETAKNLLYPRRWPRASLEWFRSKHPHVRKVLSKFRPKYDWKFGARSENVCSREALGERSKVCMWKCNDFTRLKRTPHFTCTTFIKLVWKTDI